jgi:hypothetical protein
MMKKVSFYSSAAALVLLTVGIISSDALYVGLACSCAVLGWLLKS